MTGGDETFHVTIVSTGETVAISAGRTIVERSAEVGIEVPVSCEQGNCGVCLTGGPRRSPLSQGFRANRRRACGKRSNDPLLFACQIPSAAVGSVALGQAREE